jgi:hypothetical protein
MPYIPQQSRSDISTDDFPPTTPGELNYVITKLIVEYLGNTESYTKYNEVVGVLECAKLELYRRRIAYYEHIKMLENGDVY